jgi:hypothetical protein
MLAIVLRFLPLIDAAIATFEGTRRKLVIQDTGANVKILKILLAKYLAQNWRF